MGDWAYLEYTGLGGGRAVFRGSADDDDMSAAFLDDDDVLTGLITVGRPDDLEAARELVLERARVKPDAVADARHASARVPARGSPGDRMTPCSEQLAYRGLLPQDWRDVTAPPPGIALDAGEMAGAFGEETLDGDALRRLVATLALRSDLWKPLVVSDRSSPALPAHARGRAPGRLGALSWMPGQATGFHDHGNSNVALTTLQGVVLERQLRVAGASIERELRPGIVQTGPAGYIHAVNHQSGAPAVTLHAYSPPLLRGRAVPRRTRRSAAARTAARPAGTARPHDRVGAQPEDS